MPEHNLIQRPDLIHRVQQFFGIRQAHIAPALAQSIVPVVIIADLDKHKGTPLVEGMPTAPMQCAAALHQAAVAAQYGMHMIRNPVGSGIVVSVHVVSIAANQSFRYGYIVNTADLATVVAPHQAGSLPSSVWTADTRFKRQGVGLIPPRAIVSKGTQAVDPANTSGILFLTDVTIGIPQPLPTFGGGVRVNIDEGDAFFAWGETVNTILQGNYWWEEQPKVRA